MTSPVATVVTTLYITRGEVLRSGQSISTYHEANLSKLLAAINRFRAVYGKPMSVTSGYRTMEQHISLYKALATKKGIPFDITKVPTRSAHLSGEAADFADPDGSLAAYCLAHEDLLEKCSLWMEHPSTTKGWVHLQIRACNNRYFYP